VNEELGQILAEAKEAASRDPETKNPASQLGMTDVPAPESPGGVIAFGPIERTSIIALSGLRALAALTQPKADSPARTPEPATDPTQSQAPAQQPDVPAIPPQAKTNTDSNTVALRRYLFALALASVADTGVWDLREGCILVRNGKPPTGDLRDDETPMTSVLVQHTGEEAPFALPSSPDEYLKAAADAFFSAGLPTIPQLAFDPAAARAAVEVQRGGAAEPKTKKDLIAALVALPAYAAQEAELKRKKVAELKEIWRAAQSVAEEAETGAESPSDPRET
jgi:hypothetical protein